MKKTLRIIKNIVVGLIFAAALCMMIFTIVAVNTFDRNERSLFGYSAFIAMSDSMAKTDFEAGDLILTQRVDDPSALQEGDIIAFTSQNETNYGEVVTHKIRSAIVTDNGEPAFITYGTTTDVDDETPVTYPCIIGKYAGSIPKVGTFFQFLKTIPGYICCILLPFLLLIVIQGINCIVLFKRYKREQTEEIELERKQLQQEREENEQIMRELLELKKQLNGQNVDKEGM